MRTACTLLLSGLTASLPSQEGPRVVRLEPPHLALVVEPKSQELAITFDRDMDTGGYSVCGGGTTFPQVEATNWRDARTFVIRASLQLQRAYAMELSCVTANGFRAKDGTRLAPQPWRFATAATPPADPQQKDRNEAAIARLETAIAERYSYRDRLGIDWHELVEDRRADLLAAPTDAALAVLLADMLAAGQDPHISVRFQDGQLATSSRSTLPNFRADALTKALPGLRKINKIALAGRTDDDIGYLMVATFERSQRDAFEQAIEALRSLHDCKALVLDVRMNGGGDELLAQRLAGFFVAEAKVYAAHRTRDPKAAEGFTERQDRTIRPNQAPDVFTGAVAVLMGPANMSSCEAFLLMMKQAPKAKLIGMSSAGSSGNPMLHTLAPGLQVLLPSWQALRPDGTCFEGEGITPDIRVESDDAGVSDPALQAALDRLRGKQ